MNCSSDSYLAIGQMAREKVKVKGIEILSAASLLSIDIFVYTKFWDTYKWQEENRDPRKLTSARVFNIHCKPITPNLNSEQLQNTGPLLKVYTCSIREWLAGSAVAVVLEESGRYI